MQYAFSMLTKAGMYMKVYVNGSVSMFEEGISPNIANHRELKAKISVYRSKVLRWFLILFSRTSFLNICPEHDIVVHNNQT